MRLDDPVVVTTATLPLRSPFGMPLESYLNANFEVRTRSKNPLRIAGVLFHQVG